MDSHDLMSCWHDEYDSIDVIGDCGLNIVKSTYGDGWDDGLAGCDCCNCFFDGGDLLLPIFCYF